MGSQFVDKLAVLESRIGYSFVDKKKLTLALTHRSFSTKNNERLEFLGDSLINMFVAEKLFFLYPLEKEGLLSRMRAKLVNKNALAEIGKNLQLAEYITLGKGEKKSSQVSTSIIADAVEAIIGAIYLDSNFQKCRNVVSEWLQVLIDQIDLQKTIKDPKSVLQEHMQSIHLPLPEYFLEEYSGEGHNLHFKMKCIVQLHNQTLHTQSTASTKRIAEQKCAEQMLVKIKTINGTKTF